MRCPEQRYPVIYLLSSHGNTGPGLMNWQPWDVNIQQQFDSLIESGADRPADRRAAGYVDALRRLAVHQFGGHGPL